MSGPLKWSCGVTTVPERLHSTLPVTLDSLSQTGFDAPVLFIDGSAHVTPPYTLRHPPRNTVHRSVNLRAYGNWILALWELYIREPTADRYAIFQDDILCCKNLLAYLNQCKQQFPAKGYLNLYSSPCNEVCKTIGWREGCLLKEGRGGEEGRRLQKGSGALALVFSREGVNALLSSIKMVERPMHANRGHRNIDGAIVNAMNALGWREWVHYPSLVQHQDSSSIVGNEGLIKSQSWRADHDPTKIGIG